MLGRELPFANRCAMERVERAAVAIALEHAKDGWRERGEELAVDNRTGVGAEELHVQRVVAAALVQQPDHLVDAALLVRRARLRLLRLRQACAAADEHRQTAARVRRNLD